MVAGLLSDSRLPLIVDRSTADMGAAAVRGKDGADGVREVQEVAVVDAAVVDLASERTEQRYPVVAPGRDGDRDLDASLDHLHGGPARGGGSGLLPGAVPAGGRAPLRDRAAAAWGDGAAAPGAVGGRGPAFR